MKVREIIEIFDFFNQLSDEDIDKYIGIVRWSRPQRCTTCEGKIVRRVYINVIYHECKMCGTIFDNVRGTFMEYIPVCDSEQNRKIPHKKWLQFLILKSSPYLRWPEEYINLKLDVQQLDYYYMKKLYKKYRTTSQKTFIHDLLKLAHEYLLKKNKP